MDDEDQITTLNELVFQVSQVRTAGYDVEFDILPNREATRIGSTDLFFLVINVISNQPVNPALPEPSIDGQWWFNPHDNFVLDQVL